MTISSRNKAKKINKTTLANGIRVLTEEMPDVESSSIGIWVSTGSRNETKRVNGVSHFIEHLLFKGTKKRTALDISKEIESVGGILNAFTGRESTCFYVKVLNKDLPLAIDLLSDIFMNSVFDAGEMNKERQVVLQEIKMVDDTPDDLIHDIFAERIWKGQALGWSILGDAPTIKAMKRDDVMAYFNEHYRSRGVFVTAAGGFKHVKVVEMLAKSFKRFKITANPDNQSSPVAIPGARLIKKDLEQVHVCIGVPTTQLSHPDRYKIFLVNTLLGSGMSSRLFQEVREKRGLAYSVYSYLNLCRDTGALIAYAGTSKESFAEVVRLIIREFTKLGKGVSKAELTSAKEQVKGGMLLGLETSDSRMTKLARDEMYFGRNVPVKEITAGIDAVTQKDIAETAKKLFAHKKMTITAIGKVSPKDLPKGFALD